MSATKHISVPSSVSLRFLGLCGLVAGAFIGAALILRGPDISVLPVTEGREIVLPNGDSIFVQRHEVTIAEWNVCAAQNGCSLELRARPDQDPEITPATGLSYVDVQEYITWINAKTGHDFRLPFVAEWNLMAASVLPEEPDPLFTDPALTWASAYLIEGIAPRALKPQGSFSVSPEGIADLDGSVWEWTQDCYAEGINPDRCPAFYVGGEHIAAMSYLIRDPARGGCAVGSPPAHLGVRLVSDESI